MLGVGLGSVATASALPVINGLALWYDIGFKASYPGTGSTLTDLASGITATMYGNKGYYTTSGGFFDDFYLNESYTLINSYSATNLSGLTMQAVLNYDEGQYEGAKIIASTNSGGNSFGLETRFGGYEIAMISDGGSRQAATSLSANTWSLVSGVRDVANLSVSLRINSGSRITNTYPSMSNVSFTDGWMFCRNRGTGPQYRGRVGAVLFYTRALTAAEELQNYNFYKSRYSLP